MMLAMAAMWKHSGSDGGSPVSTTCHPGGRFAHMAGGIKLDDDVRLSSLCAGVLHETLDVDRAREAPTLPMKIT